MARYQPIPTHKEHGATRKDEKTITVAGSLDDIFLWGRTITGVYLHSNDTQVTFISTDNVSVDHTEMTVDELLAMPQDCAWRLAYAAFAPTQDDGVIFADTLADETLVAVYGYSWKRLLHRMGISIMVDRFISRVRRTDDMAYVAYEIGIMPEDTYLIRVAAHSAYQALSAEERIMVWHDADANDIDELLSEAAAFPCDGDEEDYALAYLRHISCGSAWETEAADASRPLVSVIAPEPDKILIDLLEEANWDCLTVNGCELGDDPTLMEEHFQHVLSRYLLDWRWGGTNVAQVLMRYLSESLVTRIQPKYEEMRREYDEFIQQTERASENDDTPF